jgi:hypothetical protein
MANTTIQLKRSSANAVPSVLSAAEPAYSYLSNKLFIGSSDGSSVIAIGGKYFVDQQNTILTIANLAYDAANAASGSATAANGWANTVVAGANAWTNTVFGYSNTYTDTVGAAANGWANGVGTAANSYAVTVGAAANGWTNTVVAGANAWTNTVFGYSNTYTDTVGAAANGWANTTMSYANNHSDAVGVAANTYANNTFLKLTGGTVNGDLNVSGNLIVTGNTTFINVASYEVNDPLLYIASNNYVSDLVDIGFVANYANGSCTTLHTGLFRDAANANKEWYLFQGYDKEPNNNVIDVNGNNFTIAVLNATLRTSNVILNGANLWQWVNNAYSQANAAPDIANSYTITVGAASNGWANTVAAGANAWSNTKVSSVTGTSGQIYSSGGTTPTLNLITTAVTAATYGGASQIPVFTVDSYGRLTYAANVSVQAMDYAYVNTATQAANTYAATVGAAANGWANTVGTSANSYALSLVTNINGANITSGVVGVQYGGTGNTTFTTNGVLFGNGTGALQVTAAGTDGQVLVSNAGVPQFQMLDGGAF